VVRRLSFFLRLAIPVQLTLAVSGKGHASADIWFGQIRELAQDAGVRLATGQARTWQQACFEMAYTAD
jgi:hypothetical protein